MIRYFNATHIPVAARAFSDAEKLVSRHFRLTEDDLRKNKYDVKTLAFLEEHEVNDGAFAHLCKYSYEKSSDGKPQEKFVSLSRLDNAITADKAKAVVEALKTLLEHPVTAAKKYGTGLLVD